MAIGELQPFDASLYGLIYNYSMLIIELTQIITLKAGIQT